MRIDSAQCESRFLSIHNLCKHAMRVTIFTLDVSELSPMNSYVFFPFTNVSQSRVFISPVMAHLAIQYDRSRLAIDDAIARVPSIRPYPTLPRWAPRVDSPKRRTSPPRCLSAAYCQAAGLYTSSRQRTRLVYYLHIRRLASRTVGYIRHCRTRNG